LLAYNLTSNDHAIVDALEERIVDHVEENDMDMEKIIYALETALEQDRFSERISAILEELIEALIESDYEEDEDDELEDIIGYLLEENEDCDIDEETCFGYDGEYIIVNGTINEDTFDNFLDLEDELPDSAKTILLEIVPGSSDDETNLARCNYLRDNGYDTILFHDSEIDSG